MEDFFAGIVQQLFANLLFIPIGFVCLWLRYRNQAQAKETLAEKYENSYTSAGSAVVLNTVAAIGIALVLGPIVVAPILHWLNN